MFLCHFHSLHKCSLTVLSIHACLRRWCLSFRVSVRPRVQHKKKPRREENIRIHQPDRQIILSCKHKYEGMFPSPSRYLLLGYLALSSVAVPVHFAPGIPAKPSYNLLSLNEKACSYEWIWTWRDVKFIQNPGFRLSVFQRRSGAEMFMNLKCFGKRIFEGEIFLYPCTHTNAHTPDTRKGHGRATHICARTDTHSKQYEPLSSIKVICCWEITDPQKH